MFGRRSASVELLVSAAIFWPTVACAVPGECSNAALRAISPPFAQICDFASVLEGNIDSKKFALSNLQAQYNAASSQLSSVINTINQSNANLDQVLQNIQKFQEVVDSQAGRVEGLNESIRKWNAYKDSIATEIQKRTTLLPSFDAFIQKSLDDLISQENIIDAAVKTALDGLQQLGISSDVELGYLQSEFSITLNPLSGTAWFDAELPGGVKLSSDDLDAIASGKFSLPSFDVLKLATENIPITKSQTAGWASWANQPPQTDNDFYYYLSSQRFTDFFGVDRLGSDTLEGVFTGGTSVPGALDRARRQLILEWSDFLLWARETGNSNAVTDSGRLFSSIIRGDTQDFKFDQNISGNLVLVPYDYDVSYDLSKVAPILRGVAQLARASTAERIGAFEFKHLGFSVAASGSHQPTPKELVENLRSRGDETFDPIAEVSHVAQGSGLDDQIMQWISAANPAELGRGTSVATGVFDRIFPELAGKDWSTLLTSLQSKVSDSYVISLLDTPMGDRLKQVLQQIMPDQLGSVRLSSFSMDMRTGRISGNGTITLTLTTKFLSHLAEELSSWANSRKAPIEVAANAWRALQAGDIGNIPITEFPANFKTISDSMSMITNQVNEFNKRLNSADESISGINDQVVQLEAALESNRRDIANFLSQSESLRGTIQNLYSQEANLRNNIQLLASQYNDMANAINALVNQYNGIRFPIPQLPDPTNIFGGDCSFFNKPLGC